MRSREAAAVGSRSTVLLLVAVLAVALTMRAPIIAVSPVVSDLRAGLGVGSATVGVLTTIPVLCFGLGAPIVLAVVRRAGLDAAISIGLAGTFVGTLLRSVDGLPAALAGTLVLGLAITISNVLIPVIIGRDFPGRTAGATAAYTSALNVGSVLATSLTAPLAAVAGWRTALAAWALLALGAGAVWRAAARDGRAAGRRAQVGLSAPAGDGPDRPAGAPAARAPLPPLWRRPLVVGMVLAFGGQSFSYYGVTAWLPSLLADDLGLSATAAGASASIFQVTAIAGAFAIPTMVAARVPARLILLAVCAAWAALPLGLLLAPALWPVWSVCGGAAQGGGFTVIFSVVVARAADVRDSRRMSATVQGLGYCTGATGPFLVGLAHSLSGGWDLPMLVVATAVLIMLAAGSWAIGSGTR